MTGYTVGLQRSSAISVGRYWLSKLGICWVQPSLFHHSLLCCAAPHMVPHSVSHCSRTTTTNLTARSLPPFLTTGDQNLLEVPAVQRRGGAVEGGAECHPSCS